jgi:cell division septal protein FtsQ
MIWLKRLFLILSGTLVIAGAVFAVTRQSGIFRVRHIPVVINNEATGTFKADNATISDLKARLEQKLKIFEKQKIWEIKIRDLNALVLEDEWVQNVRVARVFPNKVQVEVVPRAAVFLIAAEKGKMAPVAADGEVVTALNPAALPDVPVLKGERFLKDEAIRQKALEFARQLPRDGQLSLNNISEVTWTRDGGFAVNLLSSRSQIVFGEGPITLKVARIEQILDYLTAHQLKERMIDASYSKKVLVRLRKAQ